MPADSDMTPMIDYEVWQDGLPVAMTDSLSDAHHYMAIYGQDGPVKAVTRFTYRVDGFTDVSPLSAPIRPDVVRDCIERVADGSMSSDDALTALEETNHD